MQLLLLIKFNMRLSHLYAGDAMVLLPSVISLWLCLARVLTSIRCSATEFCEQPAMMDNALANPALQRSLQV